MRSRVNGEIESGGVFANFESKDFDYSICAPLEKRSCRAGDEYGVSNVRIEQLGKIETFD